MTGKWKKQEAAPVERGFLFFLFIRNIENCVTRKIPDIYSFVTMGMIMGLRLVVL